MIKEENLPDDWEIKLIKDSCQLIMGQSPPGSSYNTESEGMPFLQGKAEFGNTFPEHTKYTRKPLRKAKKGNILISVRAPVGAVNIANIDYCIGRGLASISLLNGNNKYLFYLLNYLKPEIENKGTGSTFKAITKSGLEKIKIPVPPLINQHKIVAILEKAEKLKTWRAEADKLTDESLKSVFFKLFGDPRDNSKSWDKVNLKELVKIEKKSIKADSFDKNGNYIGLEHIESGTGRILKVMNIQKAGLKSNKYLFDEKCVLYGKLRPYLNKVALPDFEGVCSTDILPIKSIEGKSNKFFIKFLLSDKYYVKKSTEMSTGANLPRISPKTIENFKVYSPPLEIQNQFAEIVKKVETLKNYQKESKVQIDNLFNNLMQKAFKGELVC